MSLSGVVLAGGKSSRMGSDKALLPFGEYSTLAEFQYRKLESIFDKVYISTKSNKFPFSANLIFDKYDNSNPLNAIISALEYTNSDIFLISVDIPFISKETISKIVDKYKTFREYDIYIANSKKGLEPTVAIYKQSILSRAKAIHRAGDFKLMTLIELHKSLKIDIDNKDEFLNINTKKEYKKSKKILST